MFLPVEVDFTLTVVECGFVILSLFVDVILVICISFDSVSAMLSGDKFRAAIFLGAWHAT